MKAEIENDGRLVLIAENTTENFALREWFSGRDKSGEVLLRDNPNSYVLMYKMFKPSASLD